MKRQSLGLLTVGLFVLIAIAAVLLYFFGPGRRGVQTASQSPIIGKAQLGKPAPQFEVATTNGLFDLSKAEKPVFLEVFATWCPHCQRETAVVDRLYGKYRNSIDFVAVSGSDTAMDGTSTSSQADVLEWTRRFKVVYPVAYDPLLNVANLYLQGGYPTFAIIGRNKDVAYLESGEVSYDDLDAAIAKALR
ncbi:MAG TPA: TlpA family protein disulfide reductase [Candidatus Binatia bacterium]|nr:TlpA family protein disulfide reductase [Candidatus Binatia bacterium]